MDKPDIPWVPLAMVAIIFVRWLLGQFKRATEVREEKREKRSRGGETKSPAHSPVYRPKEAISPPPLQQRPTQPQSLQELFELKRKEIAEAQRRVTPPPVPVIKKVEEPAPQPEVRVPHISTQARRKPVAAAPPLEKSAIMKMFSDHGQIRKAIILKEILDKPKGLDL